MYGLLLTTSQGTMLNSFLTGFSGTHGIGFCWNFQYLANFAASDDYSL